MHVYNIEGPHITADRLKQIQSYSTLSLRPHYNLKLPNGAKALVMAFGLVLTTFVCTSRIKFCAMAVDRPVEQHKLCVGQFESKLFSDNL